jgi:hypothetical protein
MLGGQPTNTVRGGVSVVHAISGPAGCGWAPISEALPSAGRVQRSTFFDGGRVGVPPSLENFDVETARGYSAGSLGRIGTLCGASAFDQWNERREDPVACLDGHELFSVNHVAVNAFIYPLVQDQHLVRSSPQSASSTDVEVRGVDYVEAMTWQSSGDAAVDGDAQRSFWCGILSGLGAAASINVGTRPSRVDRSASAPACPKLCNPLFDGLHRASKLEWASMLASLEPPSGTGPGNGLPSPREDPLAGARVVAARSGEAGS